jgi:hypothetical protein
LTLFQHFLYFDINLIHFMQFDSIFPSFILLLFNLLRKIFIFFGSSPLSLPYQVLADFI